jgi:serine phosphatase RsbU (regulator of sigma subunit)
MKKSNLFEQVDDARKTKYQALLDAIPAPTLLFKLNPADPRSILFESGNPMAYKLLPAVAGHRRNTPLQTVFPSFETKGILELLTERLLLGKGLTFEDINYYADRLEIESAFLFRAKPASKFVLCVIVDDITAIKRDELAQQQAQQSLKKALDRVQKLNASLAISDQIVENMQLGLYVFAKQDTETSRLLVERLNQAAANRWQSQEQRAPNFEDLFPHFEKRGLLDLLLEVIDRKKPITFEDVSYNSKLLAIETAFNYKAFPLPFDRIGFITEDTTELKQKEEALQQTASELTKALKWAAHQKAEITESILYARRIQDAILPDIGLLKPILKNAFAVYKPKDIVSGDFYWLHITSKYSYLAAVDCTGHGVPGAFMSVMGFSMLNQLVQQNPEIEPQQMLAELDLLVSQMLHSNQSGDSDKKADDGMDIALIRIHPGGTKLDFAGAMRPLLCQMGDAVTEIRGARYPIGGNYANKQFEQHTLSCQPGQRFFMYSDGFVDQFGGPKARKFTTHRLHEFVKQNASLPLDAFADTLLKSFDQWRGNHDQLDDVMFLGIEPC